jgi:hypothetical protein
MIMALVEAARFQRIADDSARSAEEREDAESIADFRRREAEAAALHIAGRSARVRRMLDGDDAGGP